MTPPRTAFIEATRKVLEACPCAIPNVTMVATCRGFCRCSIGLEQGSECRWPGHAAVLAQVEAWADLACGPDAPCAVRARRYAKEHAKSSMEWYAIDAERRPIEHTSCRAALRKEITGD